jgi:hypothetical protein
MIRLWARQGVSLVKRRVGKVFRPSRYDWADIDVALIVSTGRTGTRKLAHVLSAACSGVDSRHEPFPDLFDIGTDYIRSQFSFDEAVARVRRAREQVCGEVHAAGCDYYIESNNNLALLLPVVRVLLMHCRIVHVVRDGRDFVRSAYSKTVPSARRRGETVLVMSEQDPRKRLQATDFPDDPYQSRWAHMDRFERCCWLWVKVDSLIREAIAGDGRAITVKFEDVFDKSSGYPGLRTIVEFLGLKERLCVDTADIAGLMAVKENRTQRYLLPHWTDWPAEQMRVFRDIAGAHMALYGYDL